MPEILIENCDRTSNYDALEAVARFMRLNYVQRQALGTRKIKVESGRIVKVCEMPKDESKSVCSCHFKVERAEA